MKYRTGFVTNSSSSSYVCELTGKEKEVYDGRFNEAGIKMCENNHTFLEDFQVEVSIEEKKQYLLNHIKKVHKYLLEFYDTEEEIDKLIENKTEEIYETFIEDSGYTYDVLENTLPEIECPICTLKEISVTTVLRYLFKKHNVTLETIEEINKKYSVDWRTLFLEDQISIITLEYQEVLTNLKNEIRNKYKNFIDFEKNIRRTHIPISF